MSEQNEPEFEEGVEILDPELKAKVEAEKEAVRIKTEKMRAINKAIMENINALAKEFDLKIYLAACAEELNEMGIWKSENVKPLDEMGFSRLVQNQF